MVARSIALRSSRTFPGQSVGEQRLLGVRRQQRMPLVTTFNVLEEVFGEQQEVQAPLA